ncbi:MAG: hypothetical protein R3D67_21670 [Hyphomicrobiaceae bacterium]
MRRRNALASLSCAVIAAAAVMSSSIVANAQFRPERGAPRAAPVRPGTWVLLGAQSVGFRVDRDVVRVGKRDGTFRAVKLRALGNDIEVLSIKVIYGNGQPDELPVRHFMRKNTETRAIDLRGNNRFIKEVQLVYKTRPNFKGRATVEVWGMR